MSATSCCRVYLFLCFVVPVHLFFFFFNDTATTEIYTLSLHDALPISNSPSSHRKILSRGDHGQPPKSFLLSSELGRDRKSTRLNSSHLVISYAVFCLKKKKKTSRNSHPISSST